MSSSEKIVLGAIERVDLTELNLRGLEARIDTGARYSAIHCVDPAIVDVGGKAHLAFTLLDEQHPNYNGHRYSTADYQLIRIKSSNGQVSARYLVNLTVRVAGRDIRTPFTLADRGLMSAPVLLGRGLLANRFMVDVGKEAE